MQETESADVVMRIPFGTFLVGLPMVKPSNTRETKENFGTRAPPIATTNDEYDGESAAESRVVTLIVAALPATDTVADGLERGPSTNMNGGKVTVMVEEEGRSLWGTKDSVMGTCVRPDWRNCEAMIKLGGNTQLGTMVGMGMTSEGRVWLVVVMVMPCEDPSDDPMTASKKSMVTRDCEPISSVAGGICTTNTSNPSEPAD